MRSFGAGPGVIASRLRGKSYDAGPNLTPLVDVVLVVLIFLMLVGGLARAQFLAGPAISKFKGRMPAPLRLELRICLDADGQTIVTGGSVYAVADEKLLAPQLENKFRAYVAAGIKPQDVQVVIRPSTDVKYQKLIAVYEAVLQARFSRIAFGR